MGSSEELVATVLGQDPAAFSMLLANLMSPSNEERGQAENVFNECKKHPDHLVQRLLQVLTSSGQQQLRSMSAVLVRKLISKDNLWQQLSPATQGSLKAQLLQCVQQETEKSTLKKLCDTVAELAVGVLDISSWSELLPFMFQCVSSPDDRMKESALLIFAQLAQAQFLATTTSLTPYLDTLSNVFQQCLSTSTNNDVRIAALRATTSFIQTLESAQDRDKFQPLLPAMLQVLTLSLNTREEATAQEALEMFIEVAGTEPRFLRKQLQEVVPTMLQIAEAKELEEATRQLAVEFLITLIEARERAPGMMRKLPHFIGRLFAVLLTMLLDIEDDPSWYTADTEDDDVESADYEVAQECLDRASLSLQGNSVLPVASQLLPPFLADPDWKKRHAALITLAQIAEGCAKVMIQSLDSVVNMILNSFNDPHPRVRWAAINAMGQLSTDLGPDLQESHHQMVMPALIQAMDDFSNPRVQAHAAAAVLNFSESASPEILNPYLDAVISKLLVLLERGKRMVQEGAVTALAAVADCAQDQFEKYYDTVMPYLKMLLVNCNEKEHRMLRAKAMECISLVGMAVGKEKFRGDAKQVMDVLLQLQGTQMEDDDPTISYMLQAWARLCKCLGQEFLPFMAVVMPPLMRSASLKPDVTITDADSDAEDGGEDDDSVETITIGDKKIGIRTSVLEEKATACSMLCCYADELKEGFWPWIDQVAELMVPLLKFYFHEEVRKAAVQALPELLRSAKLAVEKGVANRDQSYVKQLMDFLVTPLVELLHKEPEVEICVEMLESLNECLQTTGPLLVPSQIKAIVDQLKLVTEASQARRADRAQRKHTEDFDEEERELLEEENEQEDAVFEQVGEVLGTLIKTFKENFVVFFDELVSFLRPLMQKEASPGERRVAICIFDDVLENFGDSAFKYYEPFLPLMMEACTDSHPDVRQASVYGIGVCAQFGGANFRPLVGEALTRLTAVVSQPDSRLGDNESATDNAISAIGKICEFQQDGFDAPQVVSAWLSYLPMKGDLVEAKLVHQQLCSMVERSDSRLLGPNYQNLPKIVAVFVDVLGGGSTFVTEETAGRMVNLLRQLQQTSPPEVLTATWNSLQPQQQASLQGILSSQGLPAAAPTS